MSRNLRPEKSIPELVSQFLILRIASATVRRRADDAAYADPEIVVAATLTFFVLLSLSFP